MRAEERVGRAQVCAGKERRGRRRAGRGRKGRGFGEAWMALTSIAE